MVVMSVMVGELFPKVIPPGFVVRENPVAPKWELFHHVAAEDIGGEQQCDSY